MFHGLLKLHLNHVWLQLKTTFLRQSIQIRQIDKTYFSFSIFYCCNVFRIRPRADGNTKKASLNFSLQFNLVFFQEIVVHRSPLLAAVFSPPEQ